MVDREGIELVAVNFGKCETEQSTDELTVRNIKAIKGRYYWPEAYYEKEANILEPRVIARKLNDIKDDINEINNHSFKIKTKLSFDTC